MKPYILGVKSRGDRNGIGVNEDITLFVVIRKEKEILNFEYYEYLDSK